MRFKENIQEFFEGKQFSNGLRVEMAPKKDVNGVRVDILEQISKNKKVIHVGFADHIPVIEQKVAAKQWLHMRLLNASAKCVGIDIDPEAVKFVVDKLGISDVFTLNIVSDEVPEYLKESWDLMIVGEVLEHIDNPVDYLRSIREKYGAYVKQLVITVPNAFSLQNVQCALKGFELINSDHRYWFTPFTLAKIAVKAGFSVESFTLCQYYNGGKWWKKHLVKRHPLLRDDLLMIVNF